MPDIHLAISSEAWCTCILYACSSQNSQNGPVCSAWTMLFCLHVFFLKKISYARRLLYLYLVPSNHNIFMFQVFSFNHIPKTTVISSWYWKSTVASYQQSTLCHQTTGYAYRSILAGNVHITFGILGDFNISINVKQLNARFSGYSGGSGWLGWTGWCTGIGALGRFCWNCHWCSNILSLTICNQPPLAHTYITRKTTQWNQN